MGRRTNETLPGTATWRVTSVEFLFASIVRRDILPSKIHAKRPLPVSNVCHRAFFSMKSVASESFAPAVNDPEVN